MNIDCIPATYFKVLVPLDGPGWAERAIPHAMRVARSCDAELILLHVYKPPMHDFTDQIALAGATDYDHDIKERIEQYLTSKQNELTAVGINAHYAIVEGTSPAAAICDFINRENIDLVVMSTHGRSRLARFLFGSVAQKVMQSVRTPVMLVRPNEAEGAEVSDPQ